MLNQRSAAPSNDCSIRSNAYPDSCTPVHCCSQARADSNNNEHLHLPSHGSSSPSQSKISSLLYRFSPTLLVPLSVANAISCHALEQPAEPGDRLSSEPQVLLANAGVADVPIAAVVGTSAPEMIISQPLFGSVNNAQAASDRVDPIAIDAVASEPIATVSIAQSESGTSHYELIAVLIATILLLATATGVTCFYLLRRLYVPLRSLASSVEAIAAGNLDVPISASGTRETQTVAETINHLVDIIKRLNQEQAIASEQAHLLAEMATVQVLDQDDMESVFNRTLSEARRILGVNRVVLYRFNSDGSGYISNESVTSEWTRALNAEIADFCIPETLLEAYKNGRVVANRDVWSAGLHPDHLQLMEELQVKANLIVPMLHDGQLFGLLIAHHCAKTHDWREVEISFMLQLAAQLGVMFDRMTFVQKRDIQAEHSQFLNNVMLQTLQANTSEALLAQLPLVKIRKVLKADRVLIYQFDEEWKGTITHESVDSRFPRALGTKIYDPCFAKDYVNKYQQGRVQATPDIYQAGLTTCHLNQLEPFAVKANLVAPMLQDGKLLGLLIAHQCSGPRDWQETDIALLRDIATQVGSALDRCSLLEQKERAVKQARILAERSQFLNNVMLQTLQANTSEALLAQLPLIKIRKALKADRVLIYQFDEEWKGTITDESVDDRFPRALGAKIYDPCFAKDYVNKYQQGRVQATPDIYQAGLTTCHLNQLEPFNVKANLVAPILQGGKLVGLLIAHQCSGPRDWQEADITLLRDVATQVGSALDRCSLLEQKEIAVEQARILAEEQRRQKEVLRNLLKQKEAAVEQARILAEEQRRQKESLQQQLLQLQSSIEGAAMGDLTVRAEVTDSELGTVADFFNSIVESLRQIVMDVKHSALQVSEAIGDNEGATRQLANMALQQANKITRVLDSVQQMTDSIQAVADNARKAAEVADTAFLTAETGGKAMNQTVDSILSLRAMIGDTAKKMKRLSESSQRISRVISLIEKIALQTNLLAVNASIEAARAGEEGQGFAVVAEEVGELAAKSAAATKEVEEIIATIQFETNQVVEAMEQSTAQVVAGTRQVEETKRSLHQILTVSQHINELVKSISQATVSQTQTSQEVTSLMQEVAQVSKLTSNSSSKVSGSLRRTVTIARELQASVGAFTVER